MYEEWVSLASKHIKNHTDHTSRFELFNNPQFKNLFANGATAILVINHYTHQYEFVSDNIKYILGHEAQEFYEGQVKFGVSNVHPDDNVIFTELLFPKIFSIIDSYKQSEALNQLRLTIQFRYIRKDGQCIWVNEQMNVLETDENGNALITLWFLSDITQTKRGNEVCLAGAIRDNGQYYTPMFMEGYAINQPKVKAALTDREIELLRLISIGMSSKDIADTLSISEHTVGTHRKNMLKKIGAGNTAELLKIAMGMGLL